MESATCCGMESAQGAGWNHGNAVYGIKPQELYSIRASRNAMRDFVAIPYNARGALIPYQACGLNKKRQISAEICRFLACPIGFEPTAYRVGVCRSIQLGYGQFYMNFTNSFKYLSLK